MTAIRPATAGDFERVVEIVHGEPGPDALALAGSPELARRFGAEQLRRGGFPNPAKPAVVALDGPRVVGVLLYRVVRGSGAISLADVRGVLRVFGVLGALRRVPRFYGLTSVQFAPPPDSFYIEELHVDRAHRGTGIGGRLLEWAAEEARRVGCRRMSLHTTTSNRARSLYERHGFAVTRTKVARSYERYTGMRGRLLMERDALDQGARSS